VVGGGVVAERKTLSLLEGGAKVSVVSPHLSPSLEELAAQGRIVHQARLYQRDDLEGMFVVMAATDDPATNRQVAADAREYGILLNVVDDPDSGDFIVPSVIRRGELVVAISTGGRSPALARWLREELEGLLGEGYVNLLPLLADLRAEFKGRGVSLPYSRWRLAITPEVLDLARRGELSQAEEHLRSVLLAGFQGEEG